MIEYADKDPLSAHRCPPPALSLRRGPGFPSLEDLHFRPLRPADLLPLRLLHEQLFPVDYDDAFFHRAVNSLDDISSWAAVLQQPLQQLTSLHQFGAAAPAGGSRGGYCPSQQLQPFRQQLGPLQEEVAWGTQLIGEQLAGFVTTKPFAMQQVEAKDRALLGYGDPHWDQERALYILTLGVAEDLRHRGVASRLVELVVQGAAATSCRCVYLHVISYNTSAIAFYRRLGFRDVAVLPDFYVIRSGRQANPQRELYDAVLFAYPLLPQGAPYCIPMCSPAPAMARGPPGPGCSAGELVLPGGGILRAVTTLAACVPLTGGCNPRRRRPRSPRSPMAGPGSDGSGEGCSDGRSLNVFAVVGLGWGAENGLLQRRVGMSEGGGGPGGPGGADQQPGQTPPDWLRGFFARR